MTRAQELANELRIQAKKSRQYLENLPADKLTWKPHEKSMTLGALAWHYAEIPGWIGITFNSEEFVMEPGSYKPEIPDNVEGFLKKFDENLEQTLQYIENASDEYLNGNWAFKFGEHVVFDLPRKDVFRQELGHFNHHGGQLSVYLRLAGAPVPAVFGPTADTQAAAS